MIETEEKYLSISDLNEYIKVMFDENSFLRKIYLKERYQILKITLGDTCILH